MPSSHQSGIFFSRSYPEARNKFLSAASVLNASIESYSLTNNPEHLTDVAIIGNDSLPALVISSGLHGVEGYFGSAVQLAVLDTLKNSAAFAKVRLVLIHALNPYGFDTIRRFDHQNVDLNRNFLLPDQAYGGAPHGYHKLDHFLNPQSPPAKYEPYKLKAASIILRHGMTALKEAIVSGQYEYPTGIFFGGHESSGLQNLLENSAADWLGASERVAHIDLHTGLGKFASYKLLLNEQSGSKRLQWYYQNFDHGVIEPLGSDGVAYPINGSLGKWLQHQFQDRSYRFIGAEFGTYHAVRVLGAIRAENRAHHYCTYSSRTAIAARRELLECFCPQSEQWRKSVIDSALHIVQKALKGIG